MTVIEKAVQWAIATANNNAHGYSQASRWGPDYDCSSFVIEAYEQAGVPVREAGASYTGNMRGAFISCGFVDVTYAVGIASGYGIEAGDVLLNYAAHTCLAIGGGKVANCRTDEGHPQAGDQSGNEIRIQNYWDGSPNRWNCVLRYKGSPASSSEPTGSSSVNSNLRKGAKGEAVKALQRKLISLGYSCGKCGADGDFGNDTMKAVAEFQEDHNLTATGEVDAKTQEALNSAKKPEEEPDKEPAEKPAADKKEHAWIPPDLSMSSREEDGCVVLQALLNAHGWDCGKADGIFGAKTQAAVNQAKEFYGMKTDGKCTEELWIKLGIDPAVFERR